MSVVERSRGSFAVSFRRVPTRGDDVNRASRRQVVRRIRVAGIWINVVETVNERANELNERFAATISVS